MTRRRSASTRQGDPDPKFACKGDPATLLPHYIGLQYAEDQAGYLAGMVAATASKSGIIGAIGGITICAVCVKYIQGYELGAKFINPNIQVKTAYVTTSDFTKAFGDPVTGKAFAQQFIQQNKPDVLFQVAGLTGNGMIDAACAAGIWAVGVDVDQYLSYPNGDKCIITSAEKHLAISVSDAIKHIADGTAKGGNRAYDATNDGIGVSDFHDKASMFPPDADRPARRAAGTHAGRQAPDLPAASAVRCRAEVASGTWLQFAGRPVMTGRPAFVFGR